MQFVQDLRKKTDTSLSRKMIGDKIVFYDNLDNILTNKIAAFYHRESLKDFIDLWTISQKLKFNWGVKLYQTKVNKLITLNNQVFLEKMLNKTELIREDFEKLLKVENVFITKKFPVTKFKKDIKFLIKDIQKSSNNTLFQKNEKCLQPKK